MCLCVCVYDMGDLQRVVHAYVRWLQMDARPFLVPPPVKALSPFFSHTPFFLLSHSFLVLSKVGQTWFSQISASQWVVTPPVTGREQAFRSRRRTSTLKHYEVAYSTSPRCSPNTEHFYKHKSQSRQNHMNMFSQLQIFWIGFPWGMGLAVLGKTIWFLQILALFIDWKVVSVWELTIQYVCWCNGTITVVL